MEKRLARLKEGLACFDIQLDAPVLQREMAFLDELARWSSRINLTAIRSPVVGIEKHLIDSLFLLPYCTAGMLLDVGSGAGLPAIPLALAQPDLQIVSVDSVGKKISFQRHIRRTFALKNLSPINCRVEELTHERQFPLITARAFASIDKIITLLFPLLADGGRFILLRGCHRENDLLRTEKTLQKYGLVIAERQNYQLPFSGAQRQLVQICHSCSYR